MYIILLWIKREQIKQKKKKKLQQEEQLDWL